MSLVAAPAYAGVLDGNEFADTFAAYSGSADFSSGGVLNGTLDYAVFTAAEFAAAFPSSTYSPTDAVIYAYQIDNTGIAAISAEIIGIRNPASGPGFFEYDHLLDPPEQHPSSASFVNGNAKWLFAMGDDPPTSHSLDAGEMSQILVFSSPNIPMAGVSLTIDGGTSAKVGVPTPSATPIPEPTTLSLLAIGGLALLALHRRW